MDLKQIGMLISVFIMDGEFSVGLQQTELCSFVQLLDEGIDLRLLKMVSSIMESLMDGRLLLPTVLI